MEDTLKLLSPDVKYWFEQLLKAAEDGRPIFMKYGGRR